MKHTATLFTRLALCLAAVATLTVGDASASEWVQIQADGTVTGRVLAAGQNKALVAVDGAKISLVGENGQSAHGVTDATGQFAIKGVETGVYSLAAVGTETFACCAIHAVDSKVAGSDRLPANFEIVAADVSKSTLRAALLRYLPPRINQSVASIADVDLATLAAEVSSNSPFRIAQVNGGMKGQINSAGAIDNKISGVQASNIFIFAGGKEVARAVTGADGQFEIASLDTGVYSLLSVGSQGTALVGFELVNTAALKQAATTTNGYTLVQDVVLQPGQTFSVTAAPQAPEVEEEPVLGDELLSEEIIGEEIIGDPFGTPIGGGGYSGGGGGFSGGGGGGGGGGLIGLAAMGGVIAAVAASDDDNPVVVPPASPAIP